MINFEEYLEEQQKDLLELSMSLRGDEAIRRAKEILLNQIPKILKGIDQTESDDESGWWETSTGAEFGKERLEELLLLVKSL